MEPSWKLDINSLHISEGVMGIEHGDLLWKENEVDRRATRCCQMIYFTYH
jgi:hypothetical protein